MRCVHVRVVFLFAMFVFVLVFGCGSVRVRVRVVFGPCFVVFGVRGSCSVLLAVWHCSFKHVCGRVRVRAQDGCSCCVRVRVRKYIVFVLVFVFGRNMLCSVRLFGRTFVRVR